jgi:hypothetical protein
MSGWSAKDAIYEDDLRRYVEQHIVREVLVSRFEGGEWCLCVRLGGPTSRWIPVRSQRETVRTWASLDTLTKWADRLGLRGYALQM